MTDDVDDVAVGVADEEPAHTPRLLRQRVDDLVTTALRLVVRFVDVVPDRDRGNRILGARCVPSDELDGGSTVGGLEPGDPAEVERLDAQPRKSA